MSSDPRYWANGILEGCGTTAVLSAQIKEVLSVLNSQQRNLKLLKLLPVGLDRIRWMEDNVS